MVLTTFERREPEPNESGGEQLARAGGGGAYGDGEFGPEKDFEEIINGDHALVDQRRREIYARSRVSDSTSHAACSLDRPAKQAGTPHAIADTPASSHDDTEIRQGVEARCAEQHRGEGLA